MAKPPIKKSSKQIPIKYLVKIIEDERGKKTAETTIDNSDSCIPNEPGKTYNLSDYQESLELHKLIEQNDHQISVFSNNSETPAVTLSYISKAARMKFTNNSSQCHRKK